MPRQPVCRRLGSCLDHLPSRSTRIVVNSKRPAIVVAFIWSLSTLTLLYRRLPLCSRSSLNASAVINALSLLCARASRASSSSSHFFRHHQPLATLNNGDDVASIVSRVVRTFFRSSRWSTRRHRRRFSRPVVGDTRRVDVKRSAAVGLRHLIPGHVIGTSAHLLHRTDTKAEF